MIVVVVVVLKTKAKNSLTEGCYFAVFAIKIMNNLRNL